MQLGRQSWKRALQAYCQCFAALGLLGALLAMNVRRTPAVIVDAYKVAWVVLLVLGVLSAWRRLWRILPWWALPLPMLSIARIAVGFGQFPLLLGVPTQTGQAVLDATYWVMVVGLFATLLGGFGVLVALGFDQVQRQ